MKQYIIKEQWDELEDVDKLNFISNSNMSIVRTGSGSYSESGGLPNIGQMIEFLGDHWFKFLGGWEGLGSIPTNETLCNVLWEACKTKLNS